VKHSSGHCIARDKNIEISSERKENRGKKRKRKRKRQTKRE